MNLVELSLCFLPFLGLVAGLFFGNAIGGAIGFIGRVAAAGCGGFCGWEVY